MLEKYSNLLSNKNYSNQEDNGKKCRLNKSNYRLIDGRYCECKREFEMWLAHTIIQNTQIYCEQVVDTKVFKKYVGELVKLYYKGGI